MPGRIPSFLLASILIPSGIGAAPVQSEGDGAPMSFRDGRVAELVQDLSEASPSAARMLAELEAAGLWVVFGTPETLLEDVRREHRGYDPSRARALGFMAPRIRKVPGGGLTTDGVFIALDLERLDQLFDGARQLPRPAGMPWSRIQRLETLALLGHELVHAWGIARSGGDPRDGCLDPDEGQSTRASCVVLAENIIRREMGAPLDWGYGLSPLALLPDLYRRHVRHQDRLRGMSEHAGRILAERAAIRTLELPSLPALQPLPVPDVQEAPTT